MATKIGLIAKVLVDVPGLPPLDYRIPDDLLVAVGDLVVVPLGSRRVVGIVATLANAADCEDKRLKCISAVLHASAPLNAEWLKKNKKHPPPPYLIYPKSRLTFGHINTAGRCHIIFYTNLQSFYRQSRQMK